ARGRQQGGGIVLGVRIERRDQAGEERQDSPEHNDGAADAQRRRQPVEGDPAAEPQAARNVGDRAVRGAHSLILGSSATVAMSTMKFTMTVATANARVTASTTM